MSYIHWLVISRADRHLSRLSSTCSSHYTSQYHLQTSMSSGLLPDLICPHVTSAKEKGLRAAPWWFPRPPWTHLSLLLVQPPTFHHIWRPHAALYMNSTNISDVCAATGPTVRLVSSARRTKQDGCCWATPSVHWTPHASEHSCWINNNLCYVWYDDVMFRSSVEIWMLLLISTNASVEISRRRRLTGLGCFITRLMYRIPKLSSSKKLFMCWALPQMSARFIKTATFLSFSSVYL